MAQLGWVSKRGSQVEKIRELLDFFGIASPAQWENVFQIPQASFRHSAAFDSDTGALAAWLRKGEIDARGIQCAPYDEKRFRDALAEARALTRQAPEVFVPQLVEVCAEAGVAVVFVPELPKCRAHGATRWLTPTKALIQLSLRYKTDDHLWFTFFHEAGHILLHGKRETFIEIGRDRDGDLEEKEANDFAAELLIPRSSLDSLKPLADRKRLSASRVRRFAEEVGISPGIVVGRLQYLGWLPYTHLNKLKVSLRWAHEQDAAKSSKRRNGARTV